MNVNGERWLRTLLIGGLVLAIVAPVNAEWNKGLEAFNAKDYATAEKEFEEVTKTNEDYAGGYYMLGNAQMKANKLSNAIASYRKAVEKASGNPAEQMGYKVVLGQTQIKMKQYQPAYETLKSVSASSLPAKNRTSYALNFAMAATKTNRGAEAIKVLNSQVSADNKNASLWGALGVAYDADGNDKKAFESYKKAFETNSKDKKSARNGIRSALSVARRAGSGSEKTKYYTEAAKLSDKLTAIDGDADHYLLAGESWLGAKDYNKALDRFAKVLAKEPQKAIVHFYIGQCYSSTKQYSKAISSLQEALKGGGTNPKLRQQIYNQLGFVYDNMGKYDDAIKMYQEVPNQKMVKAMEAKKEAAAQNQLAVQEKIDYEKKIQALEEQIRALEELGDVEEAARIREFLQGLKED